MLLYMWRSCSLQFLATSFIHTIKPYPNFPTCTVLTVLKVRSESHFRALRNLACDRRLGRIAGSCSILIGCSAKEEQHVLPYLRICESDSMADSPAVKAAIPALSTSAYTAEEAKNGWWIYVELPWRSDTW